MATAEETQSGSQQMDKSEIVCPLSLKFGVVQNYRCTWRGTKGYWESRPVRGTDKWADDFYDTLHTLAPDDGGGKEAAAYKFAHQAGIEARKIAIQKVNSGEIRAPKKGWDQKFVPQGGTPLEQLKEKFPDMYAPQPRGSRKTTEPQEEETHISDGQLASLDLAAELEDADKTEIEQRQTQHEGEPAEGLHEPLTEEDMAELVVEEEAYTAETPATISEWEVHPTPGEDIKLLYGDNEFTLHGGVNELLGLKITVERMTIEHQK